MQYKLQYKNIMTRHVTKLANGFAISIIGKRLKWIISFSNLKTRANSRNYVIPSGAGQHLWRLRRLRLENIEANLLTAQYTELAISFRVSESILIVLDYDGKISATFRKNWRQFEFQEH